MIEAARSALAELSSLWPEILLSTGGILVLLVDAMLPRLRRLWVPLSAVLVVVAMVPLVQRWTVESSSFGGALEQTPLTTLLSLTILLAGLLCLLVSQSYLRREDILGGEYPALVLWCLVGLLLMVRATDLLTLFLSLELLSFCLYALTAYHRRLSISTEAGLKYFLMGAFVSAFVLLGVALVYGETGSTRLDEVVEAIVAGRGAPAVLVLAFLLLVCGFGFKMSAAPFHAWAPDAYQGAPTPFVAFLSVAPKVASIYVVVRILDTALVGGLQGAWTDLVAFLAVVSMVVGNLLALVQKDVKRMLAYSGVAHMGYALIPLVAVGSDAMTPVLVYLLAYALMNAGAFAVVALLYSRAGEQHLISEVSGWGYRFPLLGVCLTVCMLSLGGIPPTLGFVGKYLVFAHALQHGHLFLALVGIATSLVAIFYYLRVVYVLYMKPAVDEPRGLLIDIWGRLAVVVAAGATMALGIWPAKLIAWIQSAATSF